MHLVLASTNSGDLPLIDHHLRTHGVSFAMEAVSNEAALSAALGSGRVDAVLADADGFDALAVTRAFDPEMPVVLISGTRGEEAATEVMRAGASEYLVKSNLARLVPALEREIRDACFRRERARLDIELRHSNDHLRVTYESAPIGIANADENGRFLTVNRRFGEIVGYTPEELVGRHFTSISHPDDIERTLACAGSLLRGEISESSYERRYIRKDGTVVWASVHITSVTGADGRIQTIGMVEDITAKRAAQERIKLQALLLDSVENAVVATDFAGSVIYWNAGAELLYGWSVDEAEGRSVFELIGGLEQHSRDVFEKLRRGGSSSVEVEVSGRDGRVFPAHVIESPIHAVDGTVMGVVGVSYDITERRSAERLLRESEAQLAHAQDIAHLGSWRFDFETGDTTWSPQLYRVCGFDPDTPARFENFLELVHPADTPLLSRAARHALESREPFSLYCRFRRPDGAERVVQVRCRVLTDSDGRPASLLGIVQDVTEWQEAEDLLRRRAAQQEAIAELGRDALSGMDTDTLMSTAARIVQENLGCDCCTVHVQDRHGVRIAAQAGLPGALRMAASDACIALVHQTLETGTGTVQDDALGECPFKNIVTAPATGSEPGYIPAVVTAYAREVHHFSTNDATFVRSVANVIGQAVAHRQTETELRMRALQHAAVAEIGRHTVAGINTETIEHACRLIMRALGTEFSVYLEADETRQAMIARAGRRWAKGAPEWVPLSMHSPAGRALLLSEAVVVSDYTTEAGPVAAFFTRHGVRSGVCVPVIGRSRAYGVLTAQSTTTREFSDLDVDFIRAMASVIADAFDVDIAWRELIESEERYRNVVDGAGDIIFTATPTGTLTSLNPAFAVTTGWATADWVGRGFEDLLVPEDLPLAADAMRTLAGGGKPALFELRLRGKNGDIRVVEVNSFPRMLGGQLVGLYGFGRDVTESRKAEIDRARLTRDLELVLESTADGIFAINSEGRCTLVNRAATRLLGRDTDELVGQTMHDMLGHVANDGKHLPEGACAILSVLTKGQVHSSSSEAFRRKDGSVFPVEYSAAPIVDEGQIRGAVVTFTDVTERRKLERSLEQANRLSSLGRLAAIVAHEFNNVLMGIAPFTDVLRREPLSQRGGTAVEQIAASVRRGKRVTSDILRFTQPAEPTLTPVAVEPWLSGVENEVRPLLGSQHELVVNAPDTPLVMNADAAQLHQSVMNLVLNARDAMTQGGRVSISVFRDGANAHICVEDTGSGMSDEVLRHIFEPLFTTKRNGTGLGLPVTQTVIRRHGGDIFAESTPGVGTRFHVLIPLAAADAVVPEEPQPQPQPAKNSRAFRRVLLVEDEPAVAIGLAIGLEDEGFEVRTVGTAAAVSEALESFKPDVVVLDVGLPDADGGDVYADIAATHPQLPVVFSTGHGDQAKLEHHLQKAHVEFLLKPYELQSLLNALDTVYEASAGVALPLR